MKKPRITQRGEAATKNLEQKETKETKNQKNPRRNARNSSVVVRMRTDKKLKKPRFLSVKSV
jgi:hypothetical protein